MKFGVRNTLKATVGKIKTGQVMAQVECTLTEPGKITTVLTTDSVADLDLKEGDSIELLIKGINVIPVKR
ncbi:TOBE domain-containing protein [Desulfovibrio sp. OttesenSCG-928-G15]|nr:TOBE domain-containing protein [Desulfovibrio sp. OttesenSCG-928-G15]